MRRERELRRRCRRLLRELDIRPPLDVASLCARVGQHRGRPLRLRAHSSTVPEPFGAWIATPTEDYILYQRETSPAHQDHIILHELGHMVAGHQHRGEVYHDDLVNEVPYLTAEAVRRALRRSSLSYDDAQEREAELVATIILKWAAVLNRVTPRAAASAPTAARRMGSALGEKGVGWL
ncbi:hypothetical protein GCM10012275_43670 [Longimycelium tulufanense]|uniref:IrrE N-terminal-like domain-containing protein n=1 Tax=Longimycelium tulufanense TaxID=907463 RepID=A0A8J3CB63_9PSEU|nr:hypothetical protein [Longimycelium tulufanense]GGM68440.1 hypothetical protein GCM10012275_43670 [Longimycelium tulufanense]